jgi:hypothetical protein
MYLELDKLKKRQDMCEWKRETWEEEIIFLCMVWMKEIEKDMKVCRG